MEMPEAQIIERCQKGELDKFALLYDGYAKKIYTFIYFKTMHRETAEDLTSETFLKALENIRRFDANKGFFTAWLYRIARNTVIDHYRTRKTAFNVDDCWDITDNRDFAEDFANREALDKVKSCLSALGAKQREIITLRVWGGLTYQEIAEITGASEASLKMSVSRTLSKIRKEEVIALMMVFYLIQFK